MFQANKLLGELLSNPSKTIREREDIEGALLYAVDALKNVANISRQEKKESEIVEKIIHIPIEYKKNEEDEESLYTDEEVINAPEKDLACKDCNVFFESRKQTLSDSIDLILNNFDKMTKLSTVGDNPWDAFTDEKDAGAKGALTVTVVNDKQIDKSDTINIDFETKRALTGISTDIVTNHFLVDKTKYFHFIIYSYSLFIEKLNKKINANHQLEFNFLMKGGNLLKLLVNKITKNLDPIISDYIKLQYGHRFEYSDFDYDFGIKKKDTNMSNTDYNIIRTKILNCLSIFLIIIKNIIIKEKKYFFDFFILSERQQKEILAIQLKNYNDSLIKMVKADSKKNKAEQELADLDGAKITGIIFDNDSTNNDMLLYDGATITKAPINKIAKYSNLHIINNYIIAPKKVGKRTFNIMDSSTFYNNIIKLGPEFNFVHDMIKENDIIYSTVNPNIQFSVLKGSLISEFSLLRIKIGFIIRCQLISGDIKYIKVPGELLDISIARINDYKIAQSKPEYYKLITFKDINKEVYTQSYQGLIIDLFYILFMENFPWYDNKWEKRIDRLNLLLILKVLYEGKDMSLKNKINFIKSFYNNFINDFSQPYVVNPKYTELYKPNFEMYYNFLKHCWDNRTENPPKFKEFKDRMISNFEDLIKILKTHYNVLIKNKSIYKIDYFNGFT